MKSLKFFNRIVSELYNYYIKNFELTKSIARQDDEPIERSVADYIAGMTDRYAIQQYVEKFIPLSWTLANHQ